MKSPRLIFAIVSTFIELVLIAVAVLWGLPKIDINLSPWLLIPFMGGWLWYSVYTYHKGTHALKVGHLIGLQNMVGSKGKTVDRLAPAGWVRVRGELWSATAEHEEIPPDTDIIVTGRDRLQLQVKKYTREETED